MASFSRPALLALLPLLLAAVSAARPAPAPAAEVPWLYKGSDITPDPGWRFGTLANGLRYAVRRNGVPPHQVSVRVRIDAGSLMEEDKEQGFAHLIEHLSFRGSAYAPNMEAKLIWQRLGATFGSDTNAQTTPTQTVFKLDLPSATEASLGESLHLMAGMVSKPTIDQAAIDGERPAVLAEQREGAGPQQRYGDAVRRLMFAGQRLADRSPIGTVETLNAATPASVQAFHDRWYRPERVVVIVSGDVDQVTAERLVQANFSDWKVAGAAPADPDLGKPDPAKPASGTVIDASLPPVVSMAVLRPWHFNNDTVIFNQNRLVDSLAVRLINRRLETRARGGGSYISASADLDDVSRTVNWTAVNILPVGDDWEAALRDVRRVIADAEARPATQADIDRELADIDASMKQGVDTENSEAAAKDADDLVQALDIRETVTTAGTAYKILQDAEARKFFTPARVLASTRRVFTGVTRAIVTTREPGANVEARLAAALKANVAGLATKAGGPPPTFAALPALGAAGTVADRETLTGLGMERVSYANGVKLMLWANPAEGNKVYVRVRWGGGLNALPADKPSPAYAAELALVQGGIGNLGQEDLDRMTAGRRIGLDFGLEDDAFSLSAVTSPSDFADQLKLMAEKLAHPGWDPNPVARARAVMLAGYSTLAASPDGVLSRDLENLLHDGDPRWGSPPKEEVEKLDAARFKALWEPLLASGPVEVQVFGDVKADEAIKAVGDTFGALGTRAAAAAPPPPVRFPAHNAEPVVRTHTGDADRAAAVIAWPTAGGIDGLADSRRLEVLASIFQDRLFDRLRGEAGASYSPSVGSSWPLGLSAGGRVLAIGQVPPDKVAFFFTLARRIAAELVEQPVTDDELKRTMGPLIESINRAMSGNTFWMRQLTGAALDTRRVATIQTLGTDLKAITPATLQETARKYLRPDRDWTMAVVPKGK